MSMKLFNLVSFKKPRYNKFDLSHERKFSANMGELIPIMCNEIMPGDSFQVSTEMLMRIAPQLAPVMHRVHVFTHYFFVPTRLIWTQWEDFITGGEDGLQAPVHPHMFAPVDSDPGVVDLFKKGTMYDFMGAPPIPDDMTIATSKLRVSTLPFRAAVQIYNDYYRDQNVEPELTFSKGSGDESADTTNIATMLSMKKRAWEKDYFTSALPNSQRGPEITIPWEAEIEYKPVSQVFMEDGSGPGAGPLVTTVAPGDTDLRAGAVEGDARIENIESISSTNVTVNDLRRATRLQTVLEKAAVGGARYVEYIRAFFGKTSSDARLQRAEYLGGNKQPVMFSEVLSTAETAELPQGNMAGHGFAAGGSKGFRRSFEEHGFVIGFMSVLPITAYQQGLPRMFSRTNRFDYPLPELAHIGEQEILNKELYHEYETPDVPADDTFGYQSRYCEWKYQCSTVHGDFRDTLDYWHMGRKFSAYPELNEDFIKSDPTHRVFAVTDPAFDKLYVQLYNHVSALRPLPYFGTPSL